MKKVLCERPRHGDGTTYHDRRQAENRGDYDSLPACQGMRLPYIRNWRGKEFSDHIGPLRRFLWSCIGRKWNEVWSEICSCVPSGNTVDSHLLDHVRWEVETHTYVGNDGEVYVKGDRGRYRVTGLYVDPRDGLIYGNEENLKRRVTPVIAIDGYWYDRRDGLLHPFGNRSRPDHKWLLVDFGNKNKTTDYRLARIDGIWYHFDIKEAPPPYVVKYFDGEEMRSKMVPIWCKDALYETSVGHGRYHTNKRQLSFNELRRNGLINTR
jgi:hypothetical protein